MPDQHHAYFFLLTVACKQVPCQLLYKLSGSSHISDIHVTQYTTPETVNMF